MGENSEGKGLVETLRRLTDPAGKRIALLGAGGMAKIIAIIELKTTGKGTFFIDSLAAAKNDWGADEFRLGGFGQPLFSDDLFMGLEYPTSINTAHQASVSLGGIVGLNIPPEGFTSEPAVVGVAASGHVHQAFMEYVDRIRAVPARPFITYNSWYDLQITAMTNDLLLERVKQFDE